MEHHHFDQCVMILNSAGNNIFQVGQGLCYKNSVSYYSKAPLQSHTPYENACLKPKKDK